MTARKGTASFSFFRKRFRRIFPPYWFCVAATILIVMTAERLSPGIYTQTPPAMTYPTEIAPIHWFGNLTLTETWLGHVTGRPFEWKNMFLGHAWTLCYEEQFYFVVGMFLLVAGTRLLPLLVGTTLIIAARWFLGSPNINSGFFFDGRWLFFAAGFAVFYDQVRADRITWLAVRAFLFLGLAWSLRNPSVFLQRTAGIEQEWLLAFGFAWIILLLHRWDQQMASMRVLRPLAVCGVMCYSIYLVHWTVVKPIATALFHNWGGSFLFTLLVTIPACLVATVLVGLLFHLYVERRFMSAPVPLRSRLDPLPAAMIEPQLVNTAAPASAAPGRKPLSWLSKSLASAEAEQSDR
ncbi:MAG: acyltransferase [Phycisphaerales bacterium]